MKKEVWLAILSLTGLSFWFVVAYPFANHNESYEWIPPLCTFDFPTILDHKLIPYNHHRPLAHAAAWVLFRAAGNNIYGVQLLNFAVALLAWIVMFAGIKQRRIFSLAALISGGAFFAGYIYLFHLHGIFYSPVLLFTAWLFFVENKAKPPTISTLLLLSVGTIIAGLFHPFAPLIFAAYLLGKFADREKHTSAQMFLMAVMLLGSLIFAKALTPGTSIRINSALINAMLSSYRSTEINLPVSLVALGFAIATALSLDEKRIRIPLTIVVAGIGLVALKTGTPVLLVWILACIIKMAYKKKWSIATMIPVSVALPALPGTGSPTYAIFTTLLCTGALALDWTTLEQKLKWLDWRPALTASAVIIALGVSVRAGIELPVVSRITNPILAEKEKTFQLEKMIKWMLNSNYKTFTLDFSQAAVNPVEGGNAYRREQRPPTRKRFLDKYLEWRRGKPEPGGKLIACFGNERLKYGKTIYQIESKHAGTASLYILEEPKKRLSKNRTLNRSGM